MRCIAWQREGGSPKGMSLEWRRSLDCSTAIGASLDDAVTVNLTCNPLYEHRYDVEFDLGGRWSFGKRVRRLVVGPWVMGRLAARRRTFIYVGAEGFLMSLVDGRDREFAFLREQGASWCVTSRARIFVPTRC